MAADRAPVDLRRQRAAVIVASAAATLPYTSPQVYGLGGLVGVLADLALLAVLGAVAFLLGPDLHALDYSYAGLGGEKDEVLHSRAGAVLAGIAVGITLGGLVVLIA